MLGTIFILCTVSLAFVFFLLLLKLHLFSLCISSVSVYCLYTYLFSLMEMLQFNIVYRGLLKHLCKCGSPSVCMGFCSGSAFSSGFFFFTTKCMCRDRFAGKTSSKYSDSLSFTMLLEGLFHGNVVKIVVRYGF